MLFHYGHRKYKAAYKAFWTELDKTGDGEAAAKKHLYSLDAAKIKKDCEWFVNHRVRKLN